MSAAQASAASASAEHPLEPRVLGAEEAGQAGTDRIGAKAASLGALQRLGVPVPPFACVTTGVWDELIARLPEDLVAELERPPQSAERLASAGARARESIAGAELPRDDAARLAIAAHAVAGPGGALSVRSSAQGEDSARHSFAGQFDTYLWVPVEEVVDRVLRCFASAFTDRALLYRRAHGLGLDSARMAVIVQRMVDSVAAGVAFTADPVDTRRDGVLVVAGLGLGEGVVEGTVATDSFRLDRTAETVEHEIAVKSTRVVRDPSGRGTAVEDVDGDEARRPALSDERVREVARLALHVAERRGAPQDVEWALDPGGVVRLLQARPITAAAAGEETIFDNRNLVESFPGVTSPLTFSLMRKTYEHNLIGLVEDFGIPHAEVERSGHVYENLVGRLSGQMYYNLSNWYRMFLLIPGIERAVPAFERAMGFEPSDPSSERRLSALERMRWLPAQARVAARLLRALVRLGPRVREFHATHARLAAEQRDLALDRMDAHELVTRVERINRELFWRMSVAPINDFFTQQLYGALGAMIEAWDLGDPIATRNELLCGETGMESIEPVRSLVSLAERIAADAAARALFESPASPPEVLAELEHEPRLAGIRDTLRLHVERFGHRTLGELKLENDTLRDDPAPIVEILRNLLRAGRTAEGMERHELEIRRRAEADVRRRLRGGPRRVLFRLVLARCRFGLKARESMRLTRGSVVALLRYCYRALGERFVEAGLLERAGDVFMLTVDEVGDAVRGAAVTEDLAALASLRRAEQEAAAGRTLPPRIRTRGIALASAAVEDTPADAGGGSLTGIGCAPGRVRARAMVIEEPRADLRIDGEILVARTTDPGWVFLMVPAGGLVSEQGNVLSHTAIVGRELGIPTVVGVRDATRLLAGDVDVELDGRAGTVAICGAARVEGEPKPAGRGGPSRTARVARASRSLGMDDYEP
ncbi:MAG TPA: PEP/pyruvate-binding domain-containing protein [Thermoleophilaceae bacterium]